MFNGKFFAKVDVLAGFMSYPISPLSPFHEVSPPRGTAMRFLFSMSSPQRVRESILAETSPFFFFCCLGSGSRFSLRDK